MGVDWTAQFRSHNCVQAYTLVGEADHGNCGHNWLTWGNPHCAPPHIASAADGVRHSPKTIAAQAPYLTSEDRPFTRINVDAASLYQLQRYDGEHTRFNSRTVSFVREGLVG